MICGSSFIAGVFKDGDVVIMSLPGKHLDTPVPVLLLLCNLQ